MGGMSRLKRTPLVLPNKDFFPPTDTEGAERGRYIFDLVWPLDGDRRLGVRAGKL